MPATWTSEQILALAPDPASAKAGKALATSRKWSALARDGQAAWGECRGSAKEPYRTQMDLSGPAFKCSCPSRKQPCKHALGLFLLLESQPGAFTQTSAPEWVTQWLAARAKRAQKLAQKKEEPVIDPAAQAGRAADRQEKVTAGLRELELWLRDLVRQGLAAVQEQPQSFWKTPAARMVDAQAPGVAAMLRKMADLPASGEGWQERLLERVGRLYLLIEGYKRVQTLPPGAQAEIRTLIGWAQSKADVHGEPEVHDGWMVLGRRVEEEESLRLQRLWLWGQTTGRAALLVEFATGGQPFETSLVPGILLETEVVFYPSAYPLRALVRHNVPSGPLGGMVGYGYTTIAAATEAYVAALARNPWLEQFPFALQAVVPVRQEKGWSVRDVDGHSLPLTSHAERGLILLALSGGHPLCLFGEWNGDVLLPLSAWTPERFVRF